MGDDAAELVLRVANASRRYDVQSALNKVSLTVGAGEVYALVGRNGAGKSTLVKAVVGALRLDRGSVRVLGEDPVHARTARRAIGVAPQEIALYGHLTVAENLDVFAVLAGVPRAVRRAAGVEAMTEAGCMARAADRVDRLSGGWRRRANLAAAIVHRPRLLVLDEPTEGLDAEMKTALRGLIDRLRERRTAILLISHDTEDVTALADRVGVLHQGQLVAEGSPRALMAKAFGERQELMIRLDGESAEAVPMLQARGLSRAAAGASWSGLMDDALAQARAIDLNLRALGVPIDELTVRRPGLEALISWAAGLEAE